MAELWFSSGSREWGAGLGWGLWDTFYRQGLGGWSLCKHGTKGETRSSGRAPRTQGSQTGVRERAGGADGSQHPPRSDCEFN